MRPGNFKRTDNPLTYPLRVRISMEDKRFLEEQAMVLSIEAQKLGLNWPIISESDLVRRAIKLLKDQINAGSNP